MTISASATPPDAPPPDGGGRCRLYLITPPEIDLRRFYGQLEAALDAGDVACLQLRLKGASDDVILGAAETLTALTQQYNVPFLINDRPDLAAQAGADGVHIGQADASYEEARAQLGEDAIVGVTCHDSRHLAMVAAEKGADYVAFGAFFPTATKQAPTRTDPALIRWWCDIAVVQCVAIGGINAENCAPVVSAGADFIAVSAGVWDHPDGPGAAVRALCTAMEHAPLEDPVI